MDNYKPEYKISNNLFLDATQNYDFIQTPKVTLMVDSKNEISAIFENWDSGESFGYNVEEIQLLIDLLVETKTKMVTLKQTEKLSNDQQQTERPVGESNPNPS
jgi:hypothetical protein